ncbi:MAG: hypothetical protein GXP24_03965 [Planctomycetes bacterium]|nr:hypothetical protein [Planctomycetota bacterium]
MSLDSFDALQATVEQELASPISDLQLEQSSERQRWIDRQLHRSYRGDLAEDRSPRLREPVALVPSSMHVKATYQRPKRESKSEVTSWLLSFLLGVGVLAFFVGVGLLAWSTAFQLPKLWQQGMTLTIGAEGLLILSLAWMAARLWHNSRRVNRQLHSVDQQLAEIEQITGTLAGSQQASSQHFYHHANQAASPHLLVANLRGQVDQLASRMMSEL